MATICAEYAEAQTDLVLVVPASGAKVHVWNCVIESDDTSVVELKTSAKVVVDLEEGGGKIGVTNVVICGAVDEVLHLSCGPNTKISLLYDEVTNVSS